MQIKHKREEIPWLAQNYHDGHLCHMVRWGRKELKPQECSGHFPGWKDRESGVTPGSWAPVPIPWAVMGWVRRRMPTKGG